MSEIKAKIRQRTERINSEQKKIILQFIACTPEIITSTVTPEFSLQHHQLFWQNLSIILNVYGPPRKPADAWKKTWKDCRSRFRKNKVDLVEALNYIRSENPVDTESLLSKAEKMKTNEEKLSLRKSVWNSVVECLPEIVISNFQINDHTFSLRNDEDFDNECSMSNDCDSLENFVLSNEIADDSTDALVTVEEISECENDSSTSPNVDIKVKPGISDILGQSLIDESTGCPTSKRLKLSDTLASILAENDEVESNGLSQSAPKEFIKNGMKKGAFDDLLIELRKFNKIQAEKLALKKSYVDYKKMMLKNTFAIQKEIAKSQDLLATSVKTFIDNISFNT